MNEITLTFPAYDSGSPTAEPHGRVSISIYEDGDRVILQHITTESQVAIRIKMEDFLKAARILGMS